MWAFWVLFVVAAALLVLVMVKIERRRLNAHVAACQATALKIGAAYSYDPPDVLVSKLKDFDLTYADGARLAQSIRDVFARTGPAGAEYLFLHEHRGSLPGEAAGGAHRETVGCVVSPGWRLPRFRLGPERPVEKVAALLGLRDVDFASHPGFSRTYYLNADDEAAVRRLFEPKILNFFENRPGWQVEGRDDTLVVYRFRRAASVEELPAFLQTAAEISRLFREAAAKLSAG